MQIDMMVSNNDGVVEVDRDVLQELIRNYQGQNGQPERSKK